MPQLRLGYPLCSSLADWLASPGVSNRKVFSQIMDNSPKSSVYSRRRRPTLSRGGFPSQLMTVRLAQQKQKDRLVSRRPKPVTVGVLTKVLRIFEVLRSTPSGLNLTQICSRTGLNKSTTYRFVSHLEWEGYLNRDEAGTYTLGMKLFLMPSGSSYQTMLRQVARPTLRELHDITGETVNLGILDHGMVLYLDVIESTHEFRMVSRIGMRRSLYATALGKALLAFLVEEERERILSSIRFQAMTSHTITNLAELRRELETVRRQGYSLDEEEHFLGARCIGAPILKSEQESVASISIAGPVTRIRQEKVPVFAAAVRDAARKISARIGSPEPDPAEK